MYEKVPKKKGNTEIEGPRQSQGRKVTVEDRARGGTLIRNLKPRNARKSYYHPLRDTKERAGSLSQM